MILNKKLIKFKKIFALGSILFLSSTFGVGHAIAVNSPSSVVNATVPVNVQLKDFLLNTEIVNVGGSYALEYTEKVPLSLSPSISYENGTSFRFYTNGQNRYLQYYYFCEIAIGDTELISPIFTLNLNNVNELKIFSDYEIYSSSSTVNAFQIHNYISLNGNIDFNDNGEFDVSSLVPIAEETTIINYTVNIGLLNSIFSLMDLLNDSENSAYQNGIIYVLEHLDEYNLYSEQEYLQYGQSEYYRGVGSQNVLSISGLVREIFRAPISMFQNAFNFSLPLPDGTSLNVGGILTFFLTIGIALTIANLIMKIGGK